MEGLASRVNSCDAQMGPAVELGTGLQYRHTPRLLMVGYGPIERGRAPIALNTGVYDKADITRPNLLRNRDF
jgi:hypothetical protein